MNHHHSYLFKLFFCLLCASLFIFSIAKATETNTDLYPFTSKKEAERFHLLTQEIRCVVCQNQTIADSYAPLANDLRKKIYAMVLAKKSNEEVKYYLVKRYGEFILLEPSINKFTLLLWLFPFVGIAFILLILYRLLGRRS